MPFVIEQKAVEPTYTEQGSGDPSTVTLIVFIFLIYFFRNIIFAAFKFGLIAVLGFSLLYFLK
jgi:hypothetical protein